MMIMIMVIMIDDDDDHDHDHDDDALMIMMTSKVVMKIIKKNRKRRMKLLWRNICSQ